MARWPTTSRAAAAAIAALGLAGAGRADGPALEFSFHSKPVATLDQDLMQSVAPASDVRVFEPYEQAEASFRAMPFAQLLDTVYGRTWRDEEELLFTCRDGYQPSVPVRRVLAHRAWLAFASDDRPRFTIEKLESGRRQTVELAPFYLVWENLDDAALRRDGDYGWPYQLVGIDVIRAADRFPAMAPPADAGPAVARGFREFRIHCSRCHALNGEGGAIGPELNAPDAPAGRRDPAWLRRWIDDPAGIVPTARMERLNPALPERDAVIDALIAYLQAMADHPAPAPEPEPETDRPREPGPAPDDA